MARIDPDIFDKPGALAGGIGVGNAVATVRRAFPARIAGMATALGGVAVAVKPGATPLGVVIACVGAYVVGQADARQPDNSAVTTHALRRADRLEAERDRYLDALISDRLGEAGVAGPEPPPAPEREPVPLAGPRRPGRRADPPPAPAGAPSLDGSLPGEPDGATA